MSEHQLWNELGNIYANAGVYDQAIKAYGKSIELEPGFGWSYSNLASVYVQQENYEKAVPLFQRSIELLTDVSGRTAAWMRLGEAYLKMGDYGDAILAYKRALELAPDDTALQEEIEIVLAELDCVQSEQVAVPADPSASQVKGNETGAADPLPTTEEGAEPVASAVQSELEQAEMLPEEESETAVSDTRDEFTVWFENLMTELGASGLAKLQAIVSGIDAGEVKPDAPAADSAPETFAAGLAAVVKARGIWSRIESVQESEPEVEMVAMVDPEAAVDETEAEIEAAVVLVEPEAQVVKTEPEVATGALTEPELAAAETEAEIEAAVVLVEPEGEVVETEPEVETVALAEPETVA
ncbi:MAG: tetratricopeptide repeat protein, partial [Anaerolineales bacterium]|nr:tetratricopeptide repeat protein [Anaerolineales bacterium]